MTQPVVAARCSCVKYGSIRLYLGGYQSHLAPNPKRGCHEGDSPRRASQLYVCHPQQPDTRITRLQRRTLSEDAFQSDASRSPVCIQSILSFSIASHSQSEKANFRPYVNLSDNVPALTICLSSACGVFSSARS